MDKQLATSLFESLALTMKKLNLKMSLLSIIQTIKMKSYFVLGMEK